MLSEGLAFASELLDGIFLIISINQFAGNFLINLLNVHLRGVHCRFIFSTTQLRSMVVKNVFKLLMYFFRSIFLKYIHDRVNI